jgi:hypothetical protein
MAKSPPAPAAATPATLPPAPAAKRIKVRATRMGYYDLIRRREGDVFACLESEFSENWMERVPARTPERITTGQQDLQRQHDQLVAERLVPGTPDDADVI